MDFRDRILKYLHIYRLVDLNGKSVFAVRHNTVHAECVDLVFDDVIRLETHTCVVLYGERCACLGCNIDKWRFWSFSFYSAENYAEIAVSLNFSKCFFTDM